MPTRDSIGKRLSGAQQKRKRKLTVEHERQRDDVSGDPFENLPAPPIAGKTGTAGLVTWGAKALAFTMNRAMRRRDIFEAERDQLRFVADCCAKLGMIRDKGAEQDKIKRALGKARKAEKDAGLTDVTGPPPARIQRPSR